MADGEDATDRETPLMEAAWLTGGDISDRGDRADRGTPPAGGTWLTAGRGGWEETWLTGRSWLTGPHG